MTRRGFLKNIAVRSEERLECAALIRNFHENHYRCPDCGPHMIGDEDGCCSSCGADC